MKRFFLLSLFCTLLCGFSAMAEDQTLTEDFEKQSAGTTYNEQQTYTADDSNAGIGWYVEHGTVSTNGVLTGSNSMHLRAYYAKSSAAGTWNGALPYVYSTTAVTGLKSVTFNAAASNTKLKFDTYYSTDGSTWTAIQTAQALTTTKKSYSFNIPNSSTTTTYYIKIAASSSSTHNASPSSAGNFTFRIDDIVFTYAGAEKTLSSIAVSGTPTKTTYEAGEALNPAGLVVTGTYSDNSTATITEGIEWTYDYGTGNTALVAGATTCDVMASVGQITSDVYTVTGLTVNATKTLIGIEATGTPAEFWKGDTFNHSGMTITATWDDESETDVTSECVFSAPDMSSVGQKTVTVTYRGETCTYNIEVKTIANTQATAYTVAQIKSIIDAGKDLSTQVYVKGTVSKVGYAYNETNKNLTFDLSDDGMTTSQQFQCFKCSSETNPNVGVGDDIIALGTPTKYNSTYEFAQGNTIVKHDIKATLSIANISVAKGEDITPEISTNIVGDYLVEYVSSNENVVIAADNELATGDQTGTATITATIVADGYKTAETTFTVTVTTNATLSSIAISGDLTKSVYTVGDDFDFSGLTATGTLSDATTADLTSTVTWTVEPATLTATTTSVTVKATSGTIVGTKAYDVTVNKKTASITIANMEIGLNAANVAISAETTPAEATLSYSIVSGAEYITLSNGNISATAAGTATVKASYAGNDEYASKEITFTVTVNNIQTATKGSFSAGDNSGSHNFTDNTDLSFEAFQGNSATAPAINSSCLRLYQAGGYVKISGIKGVKIQSITITTGSTYTSTTVGYCVDDNDAPTTGETVAKNSAHTISGLNNQNVEIYCLGTGKDYRLDIASITVKYIKEEITLSSIAVSGNYETSFIKNAEFNHTGAVVKATFSDGDEQDVTSSAVFSEPDMTTTGEKTVTISYTHEGVEKTTSYNIIVSEEIVTEIALSGTIKRVFKTTDTFNHTGVVVTATYNSGRTAVVEDAEFSTPDLTTTGIKTVTVTYGGQSASYDIKVIPATAIFFESFDTNDGTGGNDDKWSGSIAANDIKSDNADWTFASAKGADKCAKFGTGSAAGSAKTPVIALSGAAKITFKAAAWNGNSEALGLTLSATSGTLSQTSVEMTKAAWTEFTVYLYGVEESTQITFAASQSSNNRFFLDEVMVETYKHSLNVTSHGWASVYLPYAVELPSTVKAYYASAANNSTITLSDVTGNVIPKETGVLVEAAEGTYNLNIVADVDKIQGNLFEGTLVAKTVEASSTYVLSTETTPSDVVFGKYTGTNMPANKAYLPASALSTAAGAPNQISFVKEGTSITTGIDAIDANEEAAVKFIKDGVLYIKKNGVVYNAMGQIVR